MFDVMIHGAARLLCTESMHGKFCGSEIDRKETNKH